MKWQAGTRPRVIGEMPLGRNPDAAKKKALRKPERLEVDAMLIPSRPTQ
jgi:hypothetical protein